MIDKIKKFLKDLIQGTFAICLLAVVLYFLSTLGLDMDFDGGAEEDEARAEAAAYKAELIEEGYNKGYSEGYDQGYHWGYDEGIDYGYDAGYEYGYEEGYIDCLKHYGKEKDIDKFLERDEWKVD